MHDYTIVIAERAVDLIRGAEAPAGRGSVAVAGEVRG
jgi:hypothetical protein